MMVDEANSAFINRSTNFGIGEKQLKDGNGFGHKDFPLF
jgi:hypothetical protein